MKYTAPLVLFVGFTCLVAGYLAGRDTVFQQAVEEDVAMWNPKSPTIIREVIWKTQSDQPIFTSHLRTVSK